MSRKFMCKQGPVALIVFNDEILDKVVAYIQESEKFFC
jgi:hypothetical protein